MSTPLRQRLTLTLNCTLSVTQTRLHSSFQTLGSRRALSLTSSRLLPLLSAGANLARCHLYMRLKLCMKLRILESVNCDLHASRLGVSLRDPLFLEC